MCVVPGGRNGWCWCVGTGGRGGSLDSSGVLLRGMWGVVWRRAWRGGAGARAEAGSAAARQD